ncbi:MAG: DUF4864 domain-containing protein [Albidovulum sp.]
MRVVVLAFMWALSMASPVGADDRSPQIRSVIERQMEAFGADELDRAFGFASPMIKGMFGNPENFGRMVRDGYPMIWRPSSMSFLDLREENGRLFQRLSVRDSTGQMYLFDYDMIAGADGWLINGVYPVAQPDVGV